MRQIVLTSVGRLALCRSPEQRLAAVRELVRICGDVLLLFCIVDEHIHAIVQAEAVRRARLLQSAIEAIADIPLDEPHLSKVDNRRHLESLVGYLLNQPVKHGLQGPPALWDGSCLPDLIGARCLSGFDPNLLAEQLPRRHSLAWDSVGLRPFGPVDDRQLARYGPAAIVDAAARAVGRTHLDETSHDVRPARKAAASLLRQLGYSGGQIGAALGVATSTARRLASSQETAVERTIRMQLALRDQVVHDALRRFPSATRAA